VTPHVIITPVRNEEAHLQKTIDSVAAQTCRPALWIIVNDGSTDRTAEIAEIASLTYPWIQPLNRPDRGFRKAGGGVIEAFYDGLAVLTAGPGPGLSAINSQLSTNQPTTSWDFLVKLDGDLSFDSNYFENCFAHFAADPRLGIGGGTICGEVNGELIEEAKGDPAFHVRGATKIYRRACWDQLGGLLKAPGWDTLDEVKANMLRWKTYTFRELKLKHHRFTGVADGSWKNWVKNGLANYISGYHPLFMVLKCARRLLQRPYGIAAAGLFSGFCDGYLRKVPQVDDAALIRYLRRQQINRLLFRQSIWG
jgi:poly-beta-1,6-N-acetyl-D-glucosamine synthase